MFFLEPFVLMPYTLFSFGFFSGKNRSIFGPFIFALNQHSFLFLIFIVLLVVNLIFPAKTIHPESWLLMLFQFYIVVGSRKLYKAKWRSTIIRIFTAQFFYLFVILIAIAVVFYITFINLF